jgi:hypothetical protein
VAKKLIDDFVKRHKKAASIVILIKAHSRNAVASTQIANYVAANYGAEHIPPVSVELVAFDPVPGPVQPKKFRKTFLEPIARSTVVYSTETQYNAFFNQNKVYCDNRAIISVKNNSVGYTVGVVYDGSVYKGSRIGSLPEDFYIGSVVDENEEESINKCNALNTVVYFLRQHKSFFQRSRQKIIQKVTRVFFDAPERVKILLRLFRKPVKSGIRIRTPVA